MSEDFYLGKNLKKMNKKNILFFFTFTSILVNCEPQHKEQQANGLPRIRLRTFAILSLKFLSDLAKEYEQKQKLKHEMENRQMRIQYEKMHKMELKQREIIQQIFLGLNFGSQGFLNDFHADRYF